MAKQVIGLRIPRMWTEHLDDENSDVVDTNGTESWVSQDVLKTCASVELLLIRGLPFPDTKTIGDDNVDDIFILSVLQFFDLHVDSSPIEVQRADA